jgi:N-glycosylase/DNA lyase
VAVRTLDFPLVGAGGEPVDLWRSLVSHGLTSLPPFSLDEDARTLEVTVTLDGAVRTLRVRAGARRHGIIEPVGRPLSARHGQAALSVVRKMLRLDEDLSRFYERAAHDEDLAWATAGAGRLLRSPTVFEDVVKTICTTNCSWGATVRMVGALVGELGAAGPDGRRAFPTVAAMAEADEEWYRGVARAGYRGTYLRSLAAAVAGGELDLEELAEADPADLPDDEVAARLLALPGVGPYAAAHVMLLLGRYSRLVLDSWTRPKYARLLGRRSVADAAIARRFRRYGEFAGLAFWLFLTRDWVADEEGGSV